MKDIIEKLKGSLGKIKDNDFSLLFFVVDTKGRPSGSLAYIYETAYELKEAGYNVKILHAEKEFVGVESWLGEKYAKLPHEYIDKNTTLTVSPSDFLFVQEIYSSVLSATKQLPCKRVVIFQNLSYFEDTCPMGVSFDDLKVRDCIVTSDSLKETVSKFFRGVHIDVVHRSVPKFFTPVENKKLIVNVLTSEQGIVNSIIKPFYWKYPEYKWVAFRPLPNNLDRESFAKALSEGFATIWCDQYTDFGQNALEAMASGTIVIGKIPEDQTEIIFDKEGNIKNNGIWFFNSAEACDLIAGAVRAFITDSIPSDVEKAAQETASEYTEERRRKEILNVYSGIIERRKEELEKILDYYNRKEKEEK